MVGLLLVYSLDCASVLQAIVSHCGGRPSHLISRCARDDKVGQGDKAGDGERIDEACWNLPATRLVISSAARDLLAIHDPPSHAQRQGREEARLAPQRLGGSDETDKFGAAAVRVIGTACVGEADHGVEGRIAAVR